MLDVSVSYNRYKFLGHEFLTWLWYMIDHDAQSLQNMDTSFAGLAIGNRIVLENRQLGAGETLTIKGDDAGFEEGILALKKGAVVTELSLSYQPGEFEWQFILKGESFHISNLKMPNTGKIESKDDVEGVVLEKAYLCDIVIKMLDKLYRCFLDLRLSRDWQANIVPELRKWVTATG